MSHRRHILSHPDADSVWRQTLPSNKNYVPCEDDVTADVAIVGGGITGLSTALHLAQQGIQVCVLEGHQPGWGASGRNGGQVNPTLKHDPAALHKMLGDKAESLIHAVSTSADVVFELIEQYQIACHPQRAGWIQASYTRAGAKRLHQRAEQWRRYEIPVESLDARQMLAHTGTTTFQGGWIDGRAGSVHPYAYVCGLASVAEQLGATVYGNSVVTELKRTGRDWLVNTAVGGSVRAKQVIIATNGYTGVLLPRIASTVLAANSFIVSTTALGEQSNHVLPKGETLSTAQRLLLYLRKGPGGRLLLGGRGKFSDPDNEQDFLHLQRALNQLYPELAPLDFEYRWAGRIAITRDFLPHVHQPELGLTAALGYNGRGIATGTVMGKHLANLIAGKPAAEFPFPISPVRKIPFHSLQRLYIAAGVAWFSLLDRVEWRGG